MRRSLKLVNQGARYIVCFFGNEPTHVCTRSVARLSVDGEFSYGHGMPLFDDIDRGIPHGTHGDDVRVFDTEDEAHEAGLRLRGADRYFVMAFLPSRKKS